LLCAADLHLGRQPSRLGGPVRSLAEELSGSVAWRRLIDAAIEHRVTAVLLAGDVLDDEHDYYEAFGELRAGGERLVGAGVAVVAVSGNHDVEVLPRLAQAVPDLVLLGDGGTWQADALGDDTGSVERPPLAALPAPRASPPPAPLLGRRLCGRGQCGRRYAAVTSAEPAAAGVGAWLLGDVHRPDFGLRGGYLGPLAGAGPGEEG